MNSKIIFIKTILRHLIPRTHFVIGNDEKKDYIISFWKQWLLITWDHSVVSVKKEAVNFGG